jgi:hypothetical protein
MKLIASSYINSRGAYLNGEKLFDTSAVQEDYLKALYGYLELDYPKFHKMDHLSKLSILAEQLLHHYIDKDAEPENKLQLIFANSSSSQLTDLKFQDSYTNLGNPSPSLFVYTLPNILTGELCIRHKWYGENIFFILEKFDEDFFLNQIKFSFARENRLCLCGWVESDKNGNEECFLYLVDNTNEATTQLSLNNTLRLYRNE